LTADSFKEWRMVIGFSVFAPARRVGGSVIRPLTRPVGQLPLPLAAARPNAPSGALN
jgi:hypothetical protein